jgi:tetratricopeptide (TPR) repeat protein
MRAKDGSLDPHAVTLGPSKLDPDAENPSSRMGEPTDRSARPSPAPSPLTPQRLGRYTLLGVLGRGGMGVVHEALDEQVGRKVALKLLHAELGGRQAERLVREARALARLSHPNVVQVYEVGRQGERWFIAMELVPGRTLRDWQRDHPPWRECVKVYLQAGRGLAAAHAAEITHRDFKPGNCILDDRGRVRVLDFGLARQADEASLDVPSSVSKPSPNEPVRGSLTRTGEMLGTVGYMPLEQLEGKRADARSDQWSFCASLYEALYHERPFAGDAIGALTLALMREEIRPAPRRSNVPRRLRRVLLRGLAKDPTARWPSMDALLAALSAIDGARRIRGTLAVGGVLVAGLVSLGLVLLPPAAPTLVAPLDAPGSPGPVEEDGRPPSPAALELREQAEEAFAARRIDALRDHLEHVAPSRSLPDDPTLAAELLLWRGRTAKDVEEGAALLRQAHALARDADVPSIEARAAGAMTANPVGAHAEGVDEWLRLAWVAAERVPWDRRAAIEVAITAAHSSASTLQITNDREHARALLEFADAVAGQVELEDDAFVAMHLVQLAAGWLDLEEHARARHWSLAARGLLSAVADPTHPVWPDSSQKLGDSIHLGKHGDCEAALVLFEEALAGYVALGETERASLMRIVIAGCLRRLGRLVAALELARAAADHWAHHPPVFLSNRQLAHLLVGHLLADLGRTEEARAEYEHILTIVDLESSSQIERNWAKQALEALGPPVKAR